MKRKHLILIATSIIVLIFAVFLIKSNFRIIDFFQFNNNYKLPKDRYANQNEIEEYIKHNIGLKDFELVSHDEGVHKWYFREKNERGVYFELVQKQSYDVLFGTGEYYPVRNNYDDAILYNYTSTNQLPDEDYFTRVNVEGLHSADGYHDSKAKIVAIYTNDNFEEVVRNLYDYLLGYYNYNNKLTGINRELEIYIVFQEKNTEKYHSITIGASDGCKLYELVNEVLKRKDKWK